MTCASVTPKSPWFLLAPLSAPLSMLVLAGGLVCSTAALAQSAAPAEQPAAPAATDQPPVTQDAAAAPETPAVDPVVERGKYLAQAGDCVSCHTRPGGEAFSGGRPISTPVGMIYSTNITPDTETGIGAWTEADLIKAMHEGVAKDGHHLFPAFPYTAFTKVTDDDVKAIYAYLRTLTPVHYTAPANGILLSQRWAMTFWNALFFKPARFQPDPKQSEEWNRGAYLAEGLGHCSACHSPRNLFMAEDESRSYAGGHIDEEVQDGKIRRWSAINLSPAAGGLGKWTVADITKYLQSGFAPLRAGVFGPMNDVVANSMHYMNDADVHAIAVYLKSVPERTVEAKPIPADQMKLGAATYKDTCEKCHGASGRGGFLQAPPVDGSAIAQAADPSSFINIILYGPTIAPGVKTGAWETMKPYADSMSNDDVAAVANYVRGSWSNKASPITPADVARQR